MANTPWEAGAPCQALARALPRVGVGKPSIEGLRVFCQGSRRTLNTSGDTGVTPAFISESISLHLISFHFFCSLTLSYCLVCWFSLVYFMSIVSLIAMLNLGSCFELGFKFIFVGAFNLVSVSCYVYFHVCFCFYYYVYFTLP